MSLLLCAPAHLETISQSLLARGAEADLPTYGYRHGYWPPSCLSASSMAPFSDKFCLCVTAADGSSHNSGSDGSERSCGQILKWGSRAISSYLEKSYQTKLLRMRLTAANIVFHVMKV